MAWQRVRIRIPSDIKPADRQAIGEEIVNMMKQNAVDGKGVRGSPDQFRRREFPGYTKDYEKFKGQSNVDLTLSGDMLGSLGVISHQSGSILVGFSNGSEDNAKAEGNITGSYGRAPNPRKARNFLGLIRSEVNQIVRDQIG